MVCRAASRYSSGSGARSDSQHQQARGGPWPADRDRPVRDSRRGQFTPHLRQVKLAGRGSPQLAEQRVSEPRHQRAAGALDGDQMHGVGGLELFAPDQVGQHVDLERLALRQRVDHAGELGRQPVQLAADQIAHALRHGDVTVPDPEPGRLADPVRRHLVPDQLLQVQRIAAGELARTACALRASIGPSSTPSTIERVASSVTTGPGRAGPAGRPSTTPSRRRARLLPVRTVTTSRASRVCARWCTTCAENPSSRCASSTPMKSRPRPLPADERIDHPAHARRGLGTPHRLAPSVVVNAPNGIGRADAVPTTQLVVHARGGGLAQQLTRESRLAHARRPGDHHARDTCRPRSAPDVAPPALLSRPVSASPLITAPTIARSRRSGPRNWRVRLTPSRARGSPDAIRLDLVEVPEELARR